MELLRNPTTEKELKWLLELALVVRSSYSVQMPKNPAQKRLRELRKVLQGQLSYFRMVT